MLAYLTIAVFSISLVAIWFIHVGFRQLQATPSSLRTILFEAVMMNQIIFAYASPTFSIFWIFFIFFIYTINSVYPITFYHYLRIQACYSWNDNFAIHHLLQGRVTWGICVLSGYIVIHEHACKRSYVAGPWTSHHDVLNRLWGAGQTLVTLWGTCHVCVASRWFRSWLPLSSLLQINRIWEGSTETCSAFWWAAAIRTWSLACSLASSFWSLLFRCVLR